MTEAHDQSASLRRRTRKNVEARKVGKMREQIHRVHPMLREVREGVRARARAKRRIPPARVVTAVHLAASPFRGQPG
jgi:hypothetical protein